MKPGARLIPERRTIHPPALGSLLVDAPGGAVMSSKKAAGKSTRGGAGRGQGRHHLLTDEQKRYVGELYEERAAHERLREELPLLPNIEDDEELERLEWLAGLPVERRATCYSDKEFMDVKRARDEFYKGESAFRLPGRWEPRLVAELQVMIREEYGVDVSTRTIQRIAQRYREGSLIVAMPRKRGR
jgi:hypothetical protein